MAGIDDLIGGIDELDEDREKYDDAWAFWKGTRDEEFTSPAVRRVLRLTAGRYQLNIAKLGVVALSTRLKVAAVTAQNAAGLKDEAVNDALHAVLDRNKMGLQWARLIRNTMIFGDSCLFVWPGETPEQALIAYNAPQVARVIYDDENETEVAYQIKRWESRGKVRGNLYYPGSHAEKWVLRDGGKWDNPKDWTRDPDAPEDIPLLGTRGPLYHFRTDMPYGSPAHEDTYGAQDALNKLSTTMAHTSEAAGFPQRYALTDPQAALNGSAGDNPDWDDDADADLVGEDDSKVRGGPGEIIMFNGIKSVGEWTAANAQAFIDPADFYIRMGAAIGGFPMHYIDQRGNAPSGEALALDTRVPSPDGWTTMGALNVGDRVFDETGTIQTVTQAYSVLHDRPCYRVTFDDGTEIIADADHKWQTTQWVGSAGRGTRRREVRVGTTADIANTMNRRHVIPVADPLDTPDADFLIDPYVLGVFLGDGDRHNFQVIQHVDDAEELAAHIASTGQYVRVREIPSRPTCRMVLMMPPKDAGLCQRGHNRPGGIGVKCKTCDAAYRRHHAHGDPMPQSFKEKMRALGQYKNKHIPEEYFNASHKQRLALLQGLMDTDGTVNKANDQGSVSIALSDERLAADLHRLILGLGHKVRMTSRDSKHYGRVVGTEWRFAWSAPEPVFRMERKLKYQRTDWGPQVRVGCRHPGLRYITSVEPVKSVPVRCIEVSGPSHLFLVTDALVATHNSLRVAMEPLLTKGEDVKQYLDDSAQDAMTGVLEILGYADHKADVRWAPIGVVDDTLTWALCEAKIRNGVPAEIALVETGLYDADQVEEWFARDNVEMDVSRRVTILSQLASAVSGLSQGVTMGLITEEQAATVITATVGQLTPEDTEPPEPVAAADPIPAPRTGE